MSILGDTNRGLSTTCAVCRQHFVGRRITARFCSARCRKVAERRRGGSSETNVTVNRRTSALAVGARSLKSAERAPPRPTSPPQRAASAAADVTLNQPVGIVPDGRWPNMWRVKYGDGRLSEMINLARARDALHGATSLGESLWAHLGKVRRDSLSS